MNWSKEDSGFSDEVKQELDELWKDSFFGGNAVSENDPIKDYLNAITEWKDTGDKEPLANLLESGVMPPTQTLKAIAHILTDKPRGVGTRHKSYNDNWNILTRRMFSLYEKKQLLADIKAGIYKKLQGVSINEIVADRVNSELRSLGVLRGKRITATKKTVEEDTKGLKPPAQ